METVFRQFQRGIPRPAPTSTIGDFSPTSRKQRQQRLGAPVWPLPAAERERTADGHRRSTRLRQIK